jgi:DNA processing protein
MDERSAWIALASVDGIGEETWARLFEDFGSASNSLAAANDARLDKWLTERRNRDGRVPINAPTVGELRATAADPRKPLEELTARGLWTLTPLDSDYPHRLRDLDPPPAVIHGRGSPQSLCAAHIVAVVGTRAPTIAGRALAAKVATRLAECGAVVVSGLAIGIDGAAHAATLAAGGRTVGVIGGGHDWPGPRAHGSLRAEVAARNGAVISEYHPTQRARKGTFPRRNRIIAALGDATVVVEAPIASGAKITANLALGLGRTVLVAPGRVGDWAVAGSLALLRESPALPLVGLDEMVEDLDLLAPVAGSGAVVDRTTSIEALVAMLGSTEQLVARRLLQGPAALDAIVADTALPPAVASSAVTLLLLRGWAQSIGPAYAVAGALAR